MADTFQEVEYDGWEYMTHPCGACHKPLADAGPGAWPYAFCRDCQETKTCPHGTRYKDNCNACNVLSDFAYDAWRETR